MQVTSKVEVTGSDPRLLDSDAGQFFPPNRSPPVTSSLRSYKSLLNTSPIFLKCSGVSFYVDIIAPILQNYKVEVHFPISHTS